MSRINELRKQHPNYALDIMEILRLSIPDQSTKYLELLIKIAKGETIRDDGDSLVVEWASNDDGDQILFIKPDSSLTLEEVYVKIKEQLDSFY